VPEEAGYDLTRVAEEMRRFRDSRGWQRFHNPKNLAVSIAIEAAELMELFQWEDCEESLKKAAERRQRVKEEIADVVLYVLSLVDVLQINLEEACLQKLTLNEERYPVTKSYGKALKYTELQK